MDCINLLNKKLEQLERQEDECWKQIKTIYKRKNITDLKTVTNTLNGINYKRITVEDLYQSALANER